MNKRLDWISIIKDCCSSSNIQLSECYLLVKGVKVRLDDEAGLGSIYPNQYSKLEYKCPKCGNLSSKSLRAFRSNQLCEHCSNVLINRPKELISKKIKDYYKSHPEARLRARDNINNWRNSLTEEQRSIIRHKLSLIMVERSKRPDFKVFVPRGESSYPERFFETVLNNLSIEYEREKHIHKYYLDFYIEVNDHLIDLEIDGSQHLRRRKQDKERDEYLRSLGYLVYRIPWNSINNEDGKTKMKDKIDKFIEFYNSLTN